MLVKILKNKTFKNNYLYFSDLPPSQGGKYTGFGNCANPPPRSMSTNDFYDASVNGLTNVGLILGQNVISNLKNISFKKNPDLNFFSDNYRVGLLFQLVLQN